MPPVHLTVLALDTDTARRLAATNDLGQRVVTITVRPDTRRAGWLARDLLTAVGVRHDVSGRSKSDRMDQQYAALWLAAHNIGHVLVVGVDALRPDLLDELVDLTSLSDATLWLVADHTVPERTVETLQSWPLTPVPPKEFTSRWLADVAHGPAVREVAPPAVQAALPPLPRTDFALFRAACRDLLQPDEFAQVDVVWVARLRAARQRLSQGDEPLEVLRAAVEASSDEGGLMAAVRAVQTAAFQTGTHLKVDLAALLAHDDHVPAANAEAAATWVRLRAYRQPHRQVACALAVAGLAIDEQLQATVGDLAEDGSSLRAGARQVAVPQLAQPAFRALRTSRLLSGAGPDGPLLADLEGAPAGARAVASMIASVPAELGLRLTTGQVERAHVPTATWARRRGIRADQVGV